MISDQKDPLLSLLITNETYEPISETEKHDGDKKLDYAALTFIAIFIVFFIALISIFFSNAKPWGTSSILFINDVHIDWNYQATEKSKYGKFQSDSPYTLFESAVSAAKKFNPKPTMIIMGGDYSSYTAYPDMPMVVNTTKYVLDTVRNAFPGIPLYSILGNNEFVPNYGYYKNSTYVYTNLSSVFGLKKEQLADFHKGGYYVEDIKEQKTRYIFLNTVIYNHWYNYSDPETGIEEKPEDPFDQFKWIDEKLKEGTKKGYKNAVIMHIPTAVSFYAFEQNVQEEFQQKFYEAFKDNEFSFLLCGHTHVDLLLPLFNSENNNKVVSLSSVSISPQHSNNPGFRIYEVDQGKLIDYTQYMADLTYATDHIDWYPEYTFSKEFKVRDLTAKSTLKAIENIKHNPKQMNAFMSFVNAQANSHKNFYDCLLTGSNTSDVTSCMDMLNSVKMSRDMLTILNAFNSKY